jgi:hypothetical protein
MQDGAVEKQNASLLKYRFGTIAEMQNHLHVVGLRTLFFFRSQRAELTGGSPVVVEFAIANSDQGSTLRGSVLARVDAPEGGGVWIEFPDARLAKRLDQGAAALSRRHSRRLGCDYLVEVKHGRRPFMGRMVDVSLTGVRVVGAVGLRTGATVEVRIMGAEPPLPSALGTSEVVRSDATGGDVGLRFIRNDTVARISSGKLFQAVQEAWTKALELSHPPLCCQDGLVLEPPLPHMKART